MAGRARVCKTQGNSEFEESPGWHSFAPFYSIENSEESRTRWWNSIAKKYRSFCEEKP